MLPSWSSYLAIIWAPEKYRWPWLTELFFRFEPAPLFDSDPAGERKALSESPAGPPGWEKLPVALSQLASFAVPSFQLCIRAAAGVRSLSRCPLGVPGHWVEAQLIQHVLEPPK